MNEMLSLMHNRRSMRAYLPEPPAEDLITAVVEAGRFAPSGMNKQFCHFYVITDPAFLNDLTELVSRKLENQRDSDFRYGAPVLILVTNHKDSTTCLQDSACAMENMLLAAFSMGLGSCWINQIHHLEEDGEMRAKLGEIGVTDGEALCAALSLGYPGVEFPGPREKTGNLVTWVR